MSNISKEEYIKLVLKDETERRKFTSTLGSLIGLRIAKNISDIIDKRGKHRD